MTEADFCLYKYDVLSMKLCFLNPRVFRTADGWTGKGKPLASEFVTLDLVKLGDGEVIHTCFIIV